VSFFNHPLCFITDEAYRMILEKTVTISCNAIAILCQQILLLKNVNYFSRSFLAILHKSIEKRAVLG